MPGFETRLIEDGLATDLVPSPLEYAALVPQGVGGPLPLLLFLHGGAGSRAFLSDMRPLIEGEWAKGTMPPMVIATPSAGRSFYMDYRDGSQRWESAILGPFVECVAADYGASPDGAGLFLMGISMGGMGALRMAFKHPHRFRAVIALEPGVDPAHRWEDVPPRNRFWRGPRLMEEIFGSPFDSEYWSANNPSTIAQLNAAAIRDSGLQVYIEAGDEDYYNLHEATEFLHRVLWDAGIKHEYHLVRGADHVGRSVPPRMREGFEFLGRCLRPDTGPDPAVLALHARMDELKRRFA
jgi:S-formylglutathione hydrolase